MVLVVVALALGVWGGYKYGRAKLRAQQQAELDLQVKQQAETPIPVALVHAQTRELGESVAASLLVPKAIYAAPGVETSVFFDNLVNADSNRLGFTVKCSLGSSERRRWKVTPKDEDAGEHPFEVTVTDLDGKVLGTGRSILKVAPRHAGEGKSLKFLIVGDSLTHANYYPHRFQHLMAQSGNPALTLIGTHRVHKDKDVVHEGYGGWTWNCFVNRNEPGAKSHYRERSPFLYEDGASGVKLDVARYFRENSPAGLPDLVLFQVGINDVFYQDEATILKAATTLVAAFREAAPKAALAIWLVQPVNDNDVAFEHTFQGKVKRADIRARQHELLQAMVRTFGDRESEGIYTVPMHLGVDPIDDFPIADAVHPFIGYNRLADHLYAWVKWWLVHEDAGHRVSTSVRE
jgi:lysophospholipase L1-like esterase